MTRRDSKKGSGNEEPAANRRNPRRGDKVNYKDGDDDGNDDEDSVESTEIEQERSRGRGRAKRDDDSDDDDDDDEEEDRKPAAKKRRSARSTRYQGEMKEPNSHSISDLLAGPPSTPPTKKSTPGLEDTPSSKTPAIRHNTQRRKVKTEVLMTDDDESSEFSEDEEVSDDEEPLKIQRIVASRTETRREWKNICAKINTSEVDYGSRWFQSEENNDSSRLGDDTFEERFLIKWSDLSFLHCSWELESDLLEQVEGSKGHLSSFFRKSENGLFYTSDERCDGDYFDPSWVQIDRILEVHAPEEIPKRTPKEGEPEAVTKFGIVMDKNDPNYENGTGRQFLIKWGSTPYMDSSFEFERDLIMCDVDYEEELRAFQRRSTKPSKADIKDAIQRGLETRSRTKELLGDKSSMDEAEKEKKVAEYQKELADQVYPNGGQLRDYQAEGVTWLIANYVNKRSSILADEMGLGKTLQTCAFVNLVATRFQQRGPFLVIAPLSTLEHWKREFLSWTNLNTLVYHGSQKDREFIRESEMAFEIDRPQNVSFNSSYLMKCLKNCRKKAERIWMAQVVITTPEMLTTDDFSELFAIPWEVLVVDEAHRLKSATSKLAVNLRNNKFKFQHTLLLTGTPIQNNMNELWALLNFIDANTFHNDETFLEQFGSMKSKENIDELHETIRPYILRRLKEDVEKSVPPKEETLIEVELTVVQKQYYRALYEKNVAFLHRNKKKALDGPSINNLAMQLRKCCNHPFLLRGVEEEMRSQQGDGIAEADFLVKSSGKLVLLDKLLPRMKAKGHRILVFSQFKIMLDILEDYLNARNHKVERIDGSITGKKRQQAIDRFQAKEAKGKESPFIMLLSTRAGGVGINLTAADTVIIFDSDWNPQNDLQAQARCHRIGQTKNVKVYRLLTRKTYEMQMFHMSSMKMGLDQAVLQGFESSSSDAVMSKEEIEKLLRRGAYDIFSEEKTGTGEAESNGFIEEDIDSILARRTKTVVHENTGSKSSAAGGTFSKASFKAPRTPNADGKKTAPVQDIDVDDPDFWRKMVGEGRASDRDDVLLSGQKRKRREANYSEKAYKEKFNRTLAFTDAGKTADVSSESESDDSFFEDEEAETQRERERKDWGRKHPSKLTQWYKPDAEKVARGLQTYGYGHIPWPEFYHKIELEPRKYEMDEVKRLGWSLIFMALKEGASDDLVSSRRRAERAAEKAQQTDPTATSEPSEGGVLAAEKVVKRVEIVHTETIDTCFQKLWETHQAWLGVVMEDAIGFGKSNTPRSEGALQRALHPFATRESEARKGVNALFAENVWPALRSRNWKAISVATEKGEGKRYEYKGEEYKTIKSVLASVPKIHPELAAMVESIVSSAESETKEQTEEKPTSDFDKEALKPSIAFVSNMLNKFSPLQLLVDRSDSKKVPLQKRLLTTCSYIAVAHTFVKTAGVTDCSPVSRERIAKLISLDKRTIVPHPSWKSMHDAVLIFAITRHGWIEHDSVCREITVDPEVKWGSPFEREEEEPIKVEQHKQMSEEEYAGYRNAAVRTANFLNAEPAIADSVKGFKKSNLVAVYGLRQQPPTLDLTEQSQLSSPLQPLWVVDDVELRKVAGVGPGRKDESNSAEFQSDSLADLPSKKDLLRRAKAILSKSPAWKPAQAKDSGTPAKATSRDTQEEKNPDYGYTILDQTDPANSLLVELFRSVTKVSLADSAGKRKKLGNRLIGYVRQEVTSRKEDLTHLASKLETVEASSAAALMSKIEGQINSLLGFVNSQSTQVKNVIRVMLNLPPQKPRNESEKLFPIKPIAGTSMFGALADAAAGKAKPTKSPKTPQARKRGLAASQRGSTSTGKKSPKKPKRLSNRGPAGDCEIADAMTKANDYKTKGLVDPSPDEIWLNSLETLLLTVLCSNGIPVWTENWQTTLSDSGAIQEMPVGHDCRVFWQGVARVNEAASRLWKQQAEAKFESRLRRYEEEYAHYPDSSPEKDAFLEKLATTEDEAKAKIRAFTEARGFLAQPHKLAMKCVMLIEALATKMGICGPTNRGPKKSTQALNKSELSLGPYVHQWLRDENGRWARSFEIVDSLGRPHRFTAFDFLAEERTTQPFECAAVVSKKACRMIYTQIAQQTRARSIFLKHDPRQVKAWIELSILNMAQDGDLWEYQPAWWGDHASASTVIEQDYSLLLALIQSGWSGIDEELLNHLPGDGCGGDNLSRAAAQFRANQLVREIHQIEESNKVMAKIDVEKPHAVGVGASRHHLRDGDSSDDEIELIGVKRPGGTDLPSVAVSSSDRRPHNVDIRRVNTALLAPSDVSEGIE